MAAFDYNALDTSGQLKKGVIEADSARQARNVLRERNLVPVSVSESSASGKSGNKISAYKIWQRRRIGLRELSTFTRQFATMIAAGLQIEKALQTLINQSENRKTKSILAAVRAQVMEGRTLAESLGSFPDSFSEIYRASVLAGERTGHLEIVLEQLADFTEKSYQSRQKIQLALLYPCVLTAVSFFIIVFLLTYIIPDMIKVFTDTGHSLPTLTRGLIALSGVIQHYGVLLLGVFIVVSFFIKGIIANPDIRLKIDKNIFSMPLLGHLALQYNAARFASTLGMLQESRVPLLQALSIASAVIENTYMRQSINEVIKKVSEGISLSKALEQSGIFPPVLVTMSGSGEESGRLGAMLIQASAISQRDTDNRIAMLVGLFEPLVLLVMGGIVLLLVLAIILPIIGLNKMV